MWEFSKGNTFGALAFSSFGAFWLSFWYLVTSGGRPSAMTASATFLLVWTIFTAYMTDRRDQVPPARCWPSSSR